MVVTLDITVTSPFLKGDCVHRFDCQAVVQNRLKTWSIIKCTALMTSINKSHVPVDIYSPFPSLCVF